MWYSMDFKGIDRDKGKWKCSVLLLRRYWMPVAMIINSSELRAAGFALREVFLQKLRPQRAVVARAAWGYATFRGWFTNLSCYQWMMALSLGHDVIECIFVYFGA